MKNEFCDEEYSKDCDICPLCADCKEILILTPVELLEQIIVDNCSLDRVAELMQVLRDANYELERQLTGSR